ncbi:MAG: hypothetical protein PHF84_02255 [bacterium]|nr:hypothetical protein [bacterium]
MNVMLMKKVIIILLLLCGTLYSEPATIIQTGTENGSMGDTGASYYSGISGIFYNPANLYYQNVSLLNLQGFYQGMDQYRAYSLGYLQWLESYFALGLNFVYYEPEGYTYVDPVNDVREKIGKLTHILNTAIASKIISELHYGVNFKIINNSYKDESYTAAGFDFGLMYKPKQLKDKLRVGINAMNIYSTEGQLNDESIKEPLNIKFGLSYNFLFNVHSILLAADFNSEKKYFPQYAVGVRYSYKDTININLGHNEKREFTAGLGVNYKFYNINYSVNNEKDKARGLTHSLSITFYFRPKLDDSSKERYYNKAIGYYNDFKFKPSYDLFSILYRADKDYRETEYYYEILKKRIDQEELAGGNRIIIAEKAYKEALDAYNKKQYTVARGKLIECLKNNPKHIEARLLLSKIADIETQEEKQKEFKIREKEGDYYASMNQYASALVEYNEALKLDPGNKLIEIKVENAKNELKKENTSALAYRLYDEGKQLAAAGEYNKAISKWEEALIAQADFTLAKLEIDKARRLLQEREEMDKMNRMANDQMTNMFKVAQYQASKNNFVEALFQIESALEINPSHAEAQAMKRDMLAKIKEQQQQQQHKAQMEESQHLEQGIASYKKNNVEEALYHFGKIISVNPKKSGSIKELASVLSRISELESKGMSKGSSVFRLLESHYRKGLNYYKENKFEDAAAEWQRAMKISPANTFIAGQLQNAEEKARIEKEERLSKFHLERAMDFLKKGKKDLAILEAKRILAILPNNQDAKNIVMQSVEGADKKSIIDSYMAKAKDYFDDEKYTDAIQELNLVLTIDPNDKMAQKRLLEYQEALNKVEKQNKLSNFLNMAKSYFENENYTDARRYCNDVLTLDKENPKAWELLNKIKQKEDDVKVTQVEKSRLVDVFNTGLNYFLEGNYDECILNMKKVLILDPENVQALKFIEKAKNKIAEKEKVAVEPETKVIDKKIVWSHYLKGINFYTTGNLDDAVKEWREALRIDPNNEKIRQSLNKALAKQEMLKKF